MAPIRTRVLAGFADPLVGPERWQALLAKGDTDVVFLTWPWIRAWWESYGEDGLLLVTAERHGEPVALAPLYTSEGMIYFLGLGDSDCLDFVGDISNPDVLQALLAAARERVPDFIGFRFHLLREDSPTAARLEQVAGRLGLECACEAEVPKVEVDLARQSEIVRAAVSRGMLKREEYFRARGRFEVHRLRDVDAIRPHLDEFYAQHVARWQLKPSPSPMRDPRERRFLERFLELAAATGWIRFLRIDWRGSPLAFEFAWYYKGTHVSAPWCFAIEHAKHSPGHVLLRQSVLAALEENLHTYDLGVGAQAYKLRLPGQVKQLLTWGLYPP